MKIHTDTLTQDDLYAALEATVPCGEVDGCMRVGSRKRARGYLITLKCPEHLGGPGTTHTRRRNPGASSDRHRDGYALTVDEHGHWMARLFTIDPDAIITWYNGVDHFHTATNGEYK